MNPNQSYESVLYCPDLAAAEEFYQEILGLELMNSLSGLRVFRCGPGLLLLFDPTTSEHPDRTLPPHGAEGPGHLAFAVSQGDLDAWRTHLAENKIPLEQDQVWEDGKRSLYFRDPAGNSLEITSPDLWEGP